MNKQLFSLPLGLALFSLTAIAPAFAQNGNFSDVTGANVTTSSQTQGATTNPAAGSGIPGIVPIVLAPVDVDSSLLQKVINGTRINPGDIPSPNANGQLPPGQVQNFINNNANAGALLVNLLKLDANGNIASQIAQLNQTAAGASLVTNATLLAASLEGLVQNGQISASDLLVSVRFFNALVSGGNTSNLGDEIISINNLLKKLSKAAEDERNASQ